MRLPQWLRSLVARPNRTPIRRAPRRPTCRPRVEALEDRSLPSAYVVTTTADSGPGSLRDAINQVNLDTSHALYASPTNPNSDEIDFALPDSLKTAGQDRAYALTLLVSLVGLGGGSLDPNRHAASWSRCSPRPRPA